MNKSNLIDKAVKKKIIDVDAVGWLWYRGVHIGCNKKEAIESLFIRKNLSTAVHYLLGIKPRAKRINAEL